jgi:hypothetical protein
MIRASSPADGPGSRKVGRPSSYSAARAAKICAEIASGRSVREICRGAGMPSMPTVFRWLSQHEEFRAMYTAAREAQADYIFEELLEICDDSRNDWVERQREDGSTVVVPNKEQVNRSRLRIDARKWILARMNPKRYGDRSVTELTGANGAPIKIENALAPLSTLAGDELVLLQQILRRRAGVESEEA